MVGTDDRFGLRPPNKRGLALAPQGWLLDVAPRMEGTSDIRLLLNFLSVTIEQLQQNLSQRVTRVVRDIILGEVVSHLVDQLTRAQSIIEGLNERLQTARFFARNTRFSLKLSVRLTRASRYSLRSRRGGDRAAGAWPRDARWRAGATHGDLRGLAG